MSLLSGPLIFSSTPLFAQNAQDNNIKLLLKVYEKVFAGSGMASLGAQCGREWQKLVAAGIDSPAAAFDACTEALLKKAFDLVADKDDYRLLNAVNNYLVHTDAGDAHEAAGQRQLLGRYLTMEAALGARVKQREQRNLFGALGMKAHDAIPDDKLPTVRSPLPPPPRRPDGDREQQQKIARLEAELRRQKERADELETALTKKNGVKTCGSGQKPPTKRRHRSPSATLRCAMKQLEAVPVRDGHCSQYPNENERSVEKEKKREVTAEQRECLEKNEKIAQFRADDNLATAPWGRGRCLCQIKDAFFDEDNKTILVDIEWYQKGWPLSTVPIDKLKRCRKDHLKKIKRETKAEVFREYDDIGNCFADESTKRNLSAASVMTRAQWKRQDGDGK